MQATLAKPSRLGSLTAVVLLHAVAISMFASGLVLRAPVEKPQPPQVDLLKERPRPSEPEPTRTVEEVKFALPTLPPMPIPVVPPPDSGAPSISVQPSDDPTPTEVSLPRAPVIERPTTPATVASDPVSAGMLCSRMPPPEMPVALDQAAELRVLGTVRGGRVVAVEFVAVKGLADRRALRQLQQAVDRTLRDGYQCSREGRFEQEFVFRPE